MNRKEIRYELAREMARYLLLHLQEELKKAPGVSDYIAIEGVGAIIKKHRIYQRCANGITCC